MRVPTSLFLTLLCLVIMQPVPSMQAMPLEAPFQTSETYDPIDTITRTWSIQIVLVNYEPSLIEEGTLTGGLPELSHHLTPVVDINYEIDYGVSHAGESWTDDLTQFMLENSISGPETGSQLDETALEYQENNPDEPQAIFTPRAGRAIDGEAVEDWLNENPAITPPNLGYILYIFNFSEFDSADHSFEHWYDYKPVDPDSGESQNWFRLEWDNELNPDVKLQYAGFGGRHNLFVLDASADQWYLRWARVWWGTPPYDDHPEHCTMDLEDKVDSVDLGTPGGVHALNVYLNAYLYDPVAFLFIPQQNSPSAYVDSGRLVGLIFCMDVSAAIPVQSLAWVTDATRQRYHLSELLPFIPWEVSISFLNIDNQPEWEALFWRNAYVEDGITIANGSTMFYDIYTNMRPDYIDTGSDDIQVFGVVFIKQRMEMHYQNRTFTGLGGMGQTVIWKAWERYYRPDGITPKDGVSSVQLHETMHGIGIGHTWSYAHYVGDFSYGPMGYFAFHNGTATFNQNWVQSTYLDQMEAEVWNDFAEKSQDVGDDERQETYDAQEWALQRFDLARSYYNHMMWLDCYTELLQARDYTRNMFYSQLDTNAPIIQDWGVDPLPVEQSGFDVWVTVTDDFSGVQNVSIILEMNQEIYDKYTCSQDGTNWSVSIPAFDIIQDTNLDVFAAVSDWGLNGAQLLLFSQEFTIAVPEFPAAIVFGVSAIVIVAAAGALIYRRRESGRF